MAKIFIDTNKFLDFYRYKEENKEVLEKMSSIDGIVITRQVIDEFNRNRLFEIKRLLDMVEKKEKELTDGLCNIDVVGIFAEEIIDMNKKNSKRIREIKENLVPLKENIKQMLTDDSKDIVLKCFNKILSNTSTVIIEDSEDIYNLAVKRNRLGGVPRSDKNNYKYLTICDEYIWESLLQNADDDIIFVTRDNTYFDNSKILIEEFNRKTGKDIKFVEWLSLAIQESGYQISEEAIEKEQLEQKKLILKEELSNVTGVGVENIDEQLLLLTQAEEQVIRIRFGLVDGERHTLDEVGDIFGLSREEIRKIEARALRKMRYRASNNENIQGDITEV